MPRVLLIFFIWQRLHDVTTLNASDVVLETRPWPRAALKPILWPWPWYWLRRSRHWPCTWPWPELDQRGQNWVAVGRIETQFLPARRLSFSSTTRFRLHSSSWPRPFAGSNAVVRFELRPTCLHRQRVQFLLFTTTSAISAFTRRGVSGHTRKFVRRIAHWLLQRSPGGCAESDDQQIATSVERRSPCGQRYQQVLPRLIATPQYRATLAGCPSASRVQTRRHGVQLPAWSSASVPRGTVLAQPVAGVASRQHFWSATRQLLVVSRHQLSSYGRRVFCVAGPSVWNSLPDSLQNPIIGGNSFRQSLKTFLFATYWCIQRIKGFTTMRYINPLFTYFYLLTCELHWQFLVSPRRW